MLILDKKLNEIKPYKKNPRKNDASVPLVAKSIEEFGSKGADSDRQRRDNRLRVHKIQGGQASEP